MQLDIATLFDEYDSRITFKSSIQKRYGNALLRKDKGHITGAYQKALAKNIDVLRYQIMHGFLNRNGLINYDAINYQLMTNAAGIGGCDEILLKIILFEQFILYRERFNG